LGGFLKKNHTDSGEEKREQREGRKKRERKKTGSTHGDLRKKERGGRERGKHVKNREKREKKQRRLILLSYYPSWSLKFVNHVFLIKKGGTFALYNILFFFPYLLNNKKFIIFHLPYILHPCILCSKNYSKTVPTNKKSPGTISNFALSRIHSFMFHF